VEIRRASADDVAPTLEVWRADLSARGVRPSADRAARVLDKLAAPDAVLVVAVAGGPAADGAATSDLRAAVGGLALGEWGRSADGAGDLEPGLLHLSMLVVHPMHRRHGLGSALVEGLADAAYLRGARRLSAWTCPDDPVAAAFASAIGLEATGRTQVLPSGRQAVQLVGELEPPLRELVVREAGLRLGQLLKLAGLVETGAEAKALLEAGGVEVDGAVELRRGRQLRGGEVVVAHDQAVRVVLPGP